MSWQLIISLVTGLLPIVQKIGQLWQSSAGFSKIGELLTSPALKGLEEIGAQMFPQVEKSVQKILAAIHLGYPESTKWVQHALNIAQSAGFVNFGAPLRVDGIFGPLTHAAVVALQTKLGVQASGAVTDAEYKALNLLLAGKTP